MMLIGRELLLPFPSILISPVPVASTAIGPFVPTLMPSFLVDIPRPVPVKAISPLCDCTVPESRDIPELVPVPALPVPLNVTFPPFLVWIVVGIGLGEAGTLSTYIPWFEVPPPPPVPVRLTSPERALTVAPKRDIP